MLSAMVLAAGFGRRMEHLTKDRPKPLLPFLGRPLLDHMIDELLDLGVTKIVVNAHYFADQIQRYLEQKKTSVPLIFSHEPEILETGGGVQNALPLLGSGPFLICNGDMYWHQCHGGGNLKDFIERWDGSKMDALLSVFPHDQVWGYQGKGDFHLDHHGHLSRPDLGQEADYVYGGCQILKGPSLFEHIDDDYFSLNHIYDKAQSAKMLQGFYPSSYELFHLSTPEDLAKGHEKFGHEFNI